MDASRSCSPIDASVLVSRAQASLLVQLAIPAIQVISATLRARYARVTCVHDVVWGVSWNDYRPEGSVAGNPLVSGELLVPD
jgi:hypothetical protein